MSEVKLKKLLFYNGMFNLEGHKMRSVFEREVSNGTAVYRLWRSDGKPDLDYPRAENDKYILYVEINGYLAPLGVTDFYLVDNCGFSAATESLYGGQEERARYFDTLRQNGNTGDGAILAALDRERVEIKRFGEDPAKQADYIKAMLDSRVEKYLASKESGGDTFPDFVGALALGELDECVKLSAIYRSKKEAKDRERYARIKAEEQAHYEEENRKAEKMVTDAIGILWSEGVLENEWVKFYQEDGRSHTYSIINYLMRRYGVDVPLRTQGWINEKLSSIKIKDGRCEQLRYLRSKGGRCSQKFFDCMNELICAATREKKEKPE